MPSCSAFVCIAGIIRLHDDGIDKCVEDGFFGRGGGCHMVEEEVRSERCGAFGGVTAGGFSESVI